MYLKSQYLDNQLHIRLALYEGKARMEVCTCRRCAQLLCPHCSKQARDNYLLMWMLILIADVLVNVSILYGRRSCAYMCYFLSLVKMDRYFDETFIMIDNKMLLY